MKGQQQQLDMDKWIEKGDVLIEALPYIQRFNRKIIVVKYGGSAMLDENFMKSVIQDITLLKLVGFKGAEKQSAVILTDLEWKHNSLTDLE